MAGTAGHHQGKPFKPVIAPQNAVIIAHVIGQIVNQAQLPPARAVLKGDAPK